MSRIALSEQEWETFRRHKQFRDETCMKIGVLEYESQALRARYNQQIEQSIREENEAAREIAARHHIPDSAHWTIKDANIEVTD